MGIGNAGITKGQDKMTKGNAKTKQNDTVRVALSLKRDIVEKMDKQCDSTGLTRSAYLTMLINQAVLSQDFTTKDVLEALENNEFLNLIKDALKNEKNVGE